MQVNIPSRPILEIKHVVLDYNGTLAIDGKLLPGVAAQINRLSRQAEVQFHILTADTFGSVVSALQGVNCEIHIIANEQQDVSKLQYIEHLGKEQVMAVGNGVNDRLMLQQAGLGIAIFQEEGLAIPSLIAADIVCKSILDAFAYLSVPQRLVATLRN